MLGVIWRDPATATPARCAKLKTSDSEVLAWVNLTDWALECRWTVLVTALSLVALNPTIRRLAWGPISTPCARTGFHSGAPKAGPNPTPRTQPKPSTKIDFWIFTIAQSLAILYWAE